jgi:hypothetical protein
MFEDGTVIYFFSETRVADDVKVETSSKVRGYNNIIGYILRPTADGSGTDVVMAFDVSFHSVAVCGTS